MRDVGARDQRTVELTFAQGVRSQTFIISDPRVNIARQIMMWQSAQAPTGKSQDENEMDSFDCRCAPGAGAFTAYIDSLQGPVAGAFDFAYVVR